MRVFCPAHHRGFFAPRQNPIKCENRGHVLGELDFVGEGKPPAEIRWQYCCNCEHFCPIAFGGEGIERCSVCARHSSTLYLCDRCYTISFESDTAVQTKNFALTAEGAPEPSCPGCLREAPADLHEHSCDELGATFFTPLNSCPICQERLDIGPSFPASVADYLKKTRARNKANVTFDYESELFVPVGDGEFVIVSNGDASDDPIVLPRPSRFLTKRDFYDFYQDYYHCHSPGAGEVQIIQPATVLRVTGGWKPHIPGILEVVKDPTKNEDKPLKARPPADITATTRKKPELSAPGPQEESGLTPCADCGSMVETKYAFCWKCGHSLALSTASSERLRDPGLSSALLSEDEDQTAEHKIVSAGVPLFSWALPKEPELTSSARGAMLKLIAVAVVGLLVMGLGLYVLVRWTSGNGAAPDTQAVEQQRQGEASLGPSVNPATESRELRSSAAMTEDEALRNLRERQIAASDHKAVVAALEFLAPLEKQYSNDYRFPFERARLITKAQREQFETEAFAALFLAAEKAIDRGKAQEMLQSLHIHRNGEFRTLYQGHSEWRELVQALRSKNARLLGDRR